MVELAHPWSLCLLVLPFFMRLLPPYKESRDSVRVPFFDTLVELSKERPETGAMIRQRSRVQGVLVLFMWLCLVLAAAKPQWIGPPIEQQKSGRDLMVAVDLSGSMETRDFVLPDGDGAAVDRLEAVKHVLSSLASTRESDRLGLIVFGNAPYLQTPFTNDHTIWLKLLTETEIGMAGQSTVFGDANGLAIKLFDESGSDNRVLIVLTDGNDTGSVVPPVDAAKVAKTRDIRIYTIAVGDPASVGEEALDIETLERVAQITGGRTFQALDQVALNSAYETIAELEPELYETISYRPRSSLHWLPIACAFAVYLLFHSWSALLTYRKLGANHA